jgi:hypothetical protein
MILKRDLGPGGERILKNESVALMSANGTGQTAAGRLKTFRPTLSNDVDFHPGHDNRYTLGFLMNPEVVAGAQSNLPDGRLANRQCGHPRRRAHPNGVSRRHAPSGLSATRNAKTENTSAAAANRRQRPRPFQLSVGAAVHSQTRPSDV